MSQPPMTGIYDQVSNSPTMFVDYQVIDVPNWPVGCVNLILYDLLTTAQVMIAVSVQVGFRFRGCRGALRFSAAVVGVAFVAPALG